MSEHEPHFEITKKEEDFLLGRLDGANYSGAYLPAEFLSRLREILNAAQIRIGNSGSTQLPDALKNLFGILGRVLDAHGQQVNIEHQAMAPEAEKARAEIEQLIKELKGNGDGPK